MHLLPWSFILIYETKLNFFALLYFSCNNVYFKFDTVIALNFKSSSQGPLWIAYSKNQLYRFKINITHFVHVKESEQKRQSEIHDLYCWIKIMKMELC